VRYTLALLTHGDAPHLDDTVESFAAMVTPKPTGLVCHVDGPGRQPPWGALGPWETEVAPRQEGFCRATRHLWSRAVRYAVANGDHYVFWLENDFRFDRPVDVRDMQLALGVGHYAQISLMRQAVNAAEVEAGGVLEALDEPLRGTCRLTQADREPVDWVEHAAYFTTNPSLMTVEWMLRHPWPGATRECEGRYGLMLREQGYLFAVLGDGTPWVTHLGERAGRGY
jgi:hypothetical protein